MIKSYEKVFYLFDGVVVWILMNDLVMCNVGLVQMGEELVDVFNCVVFESCVVLFMGEGKGFNLGVNLVDVEVVIDDLMCDVGYLFDCYYNLIIIWMKVMEQLIVIVVCGVVVGVGCGFVMVGDMIVCGEGGFFFQVFCYVGFVFDGGLFWLLMCVVGCVWVMEMMLLGEWFYGKQVFEWGLVNCVVFDDEVESVGMVLVQELVKGLCLFGMIKCIVWVVVDVSFEQVLQNEWLGQFEVSWIEDFVEGVMVFVGKWMLEFKGK